MTCKYSPTQPENSRPTGYSNTVYISGLGQFESNWQFKINLKWKNTFFQSIGMDSNFAEIQISSVRLM